MPSELDERAVSVIRGLAMDLPHAARSGHQGTAMALAPLAHVLWSRVLTYDAGDPAWPDRDRFVLSAGHASALLYSMLHLTGFGLRQEDLEAFRQWGSATPGHPEVGHTAGVEVTTGPLGQGFANAVGMAMAERWLRARFGAEICDHRVFAIAGDGDLSEGVSHEAASFAGHQGLGRLVVVYDDNHISIDGPTELALSDDAVGRFRSYGWHVEELGEAGDDLDVLEAGLRRALAVEDRPSLVVLRSHIAFPAPRSVDTAAAHGYALFDEEIAETKALMGLPNEPFWVPAEVAQAYRAFGARGAAENAAWRARKDAFTGDREALDACLSGCGLPRWEAKLPRWDAGGKPVATRKAVGSCLQASLDVVPGLVGGGADLTGNTGTVISGQGVMAATEPGGRQVYFGVREHAMAAIGNGMALHGGVIPVTGTFFVFSDYMRPAVRLAALSGAHQVFVWTHDSVGVGEDGPTHQPVEQLAALRAMPGLRLIRPADANETAAAWQIAINSDGPTGLVLSRQDLPILDRTAELAVDGVARGGYVLVDGGGTPEVVLIGTGSEVAVCVDAATILAGEDVRAWVVSLPSWDLFAAQDQPYRSAVLPEGVPRLAVEAGASFGWERWADDVVAIDRFGASAPGDEVLARLGFTGPSVADRARSLLARTRRSS